MPRARYDQHNAPELASLGAAIRQLRAARGLKQIEVATAAGITETQLSEIENGKANPGWLIVSRLTARGLNAPMKDLGELYDHHTATRAHPATPPN